WEPAASSALPELGSDAVAPRESDLPAAVPFRPDALNEIENAADDFFEPERPSVAPVTPSEDTAESSFAQPLTAPSSDESSTSESCAEHAPESPAREPHWMDAVAASASDHPQSDWMAALGEQQAERDLADASEQLNASDVNSAVLEAPAESAEHLETVVHSASEDAFFADKTELREQEQDFFAPESPAEVNNQFEAQPLASAGFSDEQFFPSENAPASTNASFKGPALVEPPAVHVTPEPLLVDDEPQRQSRDYGSHVDALPPAHSFFVPEGDQAAAEEPAVQDLPAPENVDAPLLSAAVDVDERIPTGHPA